MLNSMVARSSRHALDQRDLKQIIQQMNRALRDSQGGGLMERFEIISKLLFTKIVDEREASGQWNGGPPKGDLDLCWRPADSERFVYERARAVWHGATSAYPHVFSGGRAEFPQDVAGVARIVQILEAVRLSDVPNDIKGGAYEEILRNTLEKNENQQYFTPRHIVDFMVEFCDPSPGDAVCDPAAGSGGFLVGALNFVEQQGGDLSLFSESMRGAEVDERMAWIARINVLMHGGDPKSVYHLIGAGSLAPLLQLRPALRHRSFDLILTNPPFGSDMTDRAALSAFKTGRGRGSRRRGVLFVERCLDLLKPGGRVAIVLDDSVLNLPMNDDVRRLIRDGAIVEAVISLPDVTFMPYSTAKSTILVLRKELATIERQGPVFMADVENVGNRPNGDPLYTDDYDERGHRRLKSDLPTVLELHRRFLAGDEFQQTFDGTTVFAADIDQYVGKGDGTRLDVFFFHPARQVAQDRLDRSRFPLVHLGDLVEIDGSTVNPANDFADNSIRWIGLGDIEARTGRFEVHEQPGDRIRSNAHVFRGGDVLFSRLRPKLRKAILIPQDDEGGVCSSELLVLRVRPEYGDQLAPEFFAALLRSDLVYGQLIYQITGIGRPRVSADAVRRLLIPLPPFSTQHDYVQELSAAERQADRLRTEATHLVELAFHEVEKAFDRVIAEMLPEDQMGSCSSLDGVADLESDRAVV